MEKLRWMQAQSDSKQLILAMKGKKNPSYMEVKRLAACLVSALDALLPEGQPMLIVLEYDMAKSPGADDDAAFNRASEGCHLH